MMMTVQQTAPFSGLLLFAVSRYSFPAVAKSAAGRENPSLTVATPDAPCVFFCVYAFAHPFIGQRFFVCCAVKIMVAQAGLTSVRPVSFRAGISTPVWATTSGRGNSGGSVNRYLKEIAAMASIPTLSHPEFTFVFLAVRRTDYAARPFAVRTVATCERAARMKLVADFVLSFAARIPMNNLGEVSA